ncbi:MAG: dihydropteroate synthase [Myxococcota bacterium]
MVPAPPTAKPAAPTPTGASASRYAPQILGVLNVSPESMVTESIAIGDAAVRERAAMLVRTGADWIDLGGRSITPDAPMIDDATEQARLFAALAVLRSGDAGSAAGATDASRVADTTDRTGAAGSAQRAGGAARYRVSIDTWSAATGEAALEHGADAVNYTGGPLPTSLLDAVARRAALLFVTYMPYANAYAMRSAPPAPVGIEAVLEHLGPKVEAARRAGVERLVLDPNVGIIHPSTDDHRKIHQQLEIVWQLDRLRGLGCPILLYAARKPEPLARIMMASAVLHARADYVRTHTPEMIRRLLAVGD